MKRKIAILGSTGSIGKTLCSVIAKDKNNFELLLLTANKNHQLLLKQAKEFKVKNLIIINKKSYDILIKKTKNININVFNNFDSFNKIFTKKIDYIMSSITGIDGLKPTINIIKFTKKIVIANKEAIICGWNIIEKKLKKYKTKFIPVDSEHFSLWYGLKNNNDYVKKIYLTASGGPFNNLSLNKFKFIKVSDALKHPNWKMGKKISVDSATMMNKVFEVIEAKKIFNFNYKNIKILIHPISYIHAVVEYQNGLIKIIAHDTNMKIPIFNTVYENSDKKINNNQLNIDKINNLNISNINTKRFPLVNIINQLPEQNSLFETIIVSANDELVNLFLKNKIKFTDISKRLLYFINIKEFHKFKFKQPKNIDEIIKLKDYVRLKIISNSV